MQISVVTKAQSQSTGVLKVDITLVVAITITEPVTSVILMAPNHRLVALSVRVLSYLREEPGKILEKYTNLNGIIPILTFPRTESEQESTECSLLHWLDQPLEKCGDL